MVIIVFSGDCNPSHKMRFFFFRSTRLLFHAKLFMITVTSMMNTSIAGLCMWSSSTAGSSLTFPGVFLNVLAHYRRMMETSCYAHPGKPEQRNNHSKMHLYSRCNYPWMHGAGSARWKHKLPSKERNIYFLETRTVQRLRPSH